MNYRQISRTLGYLLMVLSGAMATSIPWAFVKNDPDGTKVAFGFSVGLTFGSGLLGWFFGRLEKGTLQRRDAILIVALSWLLLGIFGGLPYLLDGAVTNPVDAYFEAISGFTTTGSTILTNIEGISHTLHWWRGMTQWLGGMGIIVLFVAIFPHLGVGGKFLFKTEAPGPITDGLKPKIRETSWALWRIYAGMTLLLTALLYITGPNKATVVAKGLSVKAEMDLHNALIHAFTTMATGGFSTLNDSVAGFDSVTVEVVITIFMFLAGINFSLYYLAFRGNTRKALRDSELKVYCALVVCATLLITWNIFGTGTPGEVGYEKHTSLLSSLRQAGFQVVTIVTTTGFGTDNFNLWPPMSKLMLVFLMIGGGMAGSTSGGMKLFRFVIIYKAIRIRLYEVFRPAAIQVVKVGKKTISREVVNDTLVYFALAILLFVAACLYMGFLGLDVVTATTSVATTLFNTGPGLARVGSIENFAFIPLSGKMILSFCMILGRLEFYSLLVLLLPEFWRE